MEARQEKKQKNYKSSGGQFNQFERSFEVRSKYGFFKTPKATKYSYKRKHESPSRRNFLSNYSHHKKWRNDASKNSNSTTENSEEEERKKKLSDVANKLLSKIKMWNAENNSSEVVTQSGNDSEQISAVEGAIIKSFDQSQSESVSSSKNCLQACVTIEEGKPKRIAHSKNRSKLCSGKKKVPVSRNQIEKSFSKSRKYDVNKATLKDFQNRIQHKLINELIQMPKENLQNVLNDPKINPIMELKMSRLVKENKLLITQKLRSLAESKMTSNDFSRNPQLLVDIDKFIDPVIETDLSVLPCELIKAMENIFQVQFDYSNNSGADGEVSTSEVTSSTSNVVSDWDQLDLSVENAIIPKLENLNKSPTPGLAENPTSSLENHEIFSPQKLNVDFNADYVTDTNLDNQSESLDQEDLTIYECSTDEDEEMGTNDSDSGECNPETNSNDAERSENGDILPKEIQIVSKPVKRKSVFDDDGISNDNKKKKVSEEHSERPKHSGNLQPDFPEQDSRKENLPTCVDVRFLNEFNEDSVNGVPDQEKETHIPENPKKPVECSSSSPVQQKKFSSVACQTEVTLKDAEIQTVVETSDRDPGNIVPLMTKPTIGSASSLLEEVNSIQNFINHLNERRFMIFLELARTNPSWDFTGDRFTKDNFVETVSNGNFCVVDLLQKFFREMQGNSGNKLPTFNERNFRKKKKKPKKQKFGKNSVSVENGPL